MLTTSWKLFDITSTGSFQGVRTPPATSRCPHSIWDISLAGRASVWIQGSDAIKIESRSNSLFRDLVVFSDRIAAGRVTILVRDFQIVYVHELL